jgi:hypothetical protein
MKKNLLSPLLFVFAIYAGAQIPITDLQMWYKADVGFSGFTWTDQSGKGNTLSGIDAAPVQMTETGNQFLRFNTMQLTFPFPQTHWCDMRKISGVTWSATSTGTSIFMVYRRNSLLNDGSNAGVVLGGATTALSLFNCAASSAAFRTGAASNNFAPSASREISSGIFTPNNSAGNELYINGALISQVSTTGISGNAAMSTISISNLGVPVDSYIDIFEVIVYSAPLSTTDRKQVENYLAAKYNISLPLTLISFSGAKRNETVQLEWKTENEENISHFEIERSNDGRAFEKAGVVAGRNSAGLHIYSFTDNAIWNSDTRFYKIKIVDIDGKYAYSKLVRLVNKNAGALVVFPNPANDVITISGLNGAGEIKLSSVEGKELIKQPVRGQSQVLNISSLSVAIYILQYNNDGKTLFQKLIKQ